MRNNRGYRGAHGAARALNAIVSALWEIPRHWIQRGAENYQDPSRSGNIPHLPVMGPLPPRQERNQILAITSSPSGATFNINGDSYPNQVGDNYQTPMGLRLPRGTYYVTFQDPYNGMNFIGWDDGVIDNPREIRLRRNNRHTGEYQ